jgi:hypothetical protein
MDSFYAIVEEKVAIVKIKKSFSVPAKEAGDQL